MEDEEIVQLFCKRDQMAIQEVRIRYGAKLYQVAMNIVKNHEDAEECVSDTYLKAWQAIPPQTPRFLFAYLAKICRFLSFAKIDWKNAQKRNARIIELTAEMELCIPSPYEERRVESEEISELLNEFLKLISKENRLLFVRRYWYADSIQEISQRYGISESKVKTTLHRTRKKLKSYLEREGVTV